MSYIYKITNLINNKVYIGRTDNSLGKRFKQHLYDSRKERYKNRKLYKAFNKYGIENFKIELIQECQKNVSCNREKYWICHYNAYYNGYNENFGGSGNNKYNHKNIKKELEKLPYPFLVSKKCGCSRFVVYNVAKENNIKVRNYNLDNCINVNNRKEIIQYDKITNKCLNKFNSVQEASKWLLENGIIKILNSGVRSHIADVANEKRKSAYGYKWKYK